MKKDEIIAFPRKRLFIDILTQDVNVTTCILDLIDNSVDSYVRNKIEENRTLSLIVNKDQFEITDTCGGISHEFLKNQVFKFGSANRQIENPTLGMYGIGLKRSVFKLGNNITLETDDGSNYSYMTLDVLEWEKNEDDWNIPFEFDTTNLKNGEKPYTKITVTNLLPEIVEKFKLDIYLNDLIKSIRKVYCQIIKSKISFNFNSEILEPSPLLIPVNEEYQPSVNVENIDDVEIEIICFIDPSGGKKMTNAVNERGWNLFCNERLILANETSEITGWKGGGDKSMLPKYHNTYNEFRGLVFLKSNNPFKLPLNTSKSGLNTEHVIYHSVLNLMVKTAKPVIEYLALKYKKENEAEDEIEKIMDENKIEDFKANYVDFKAISVNSAFKAPKREDIESKVLTARISYVKDKILVLKAMEYFEVGTYKEVGEKTFNYFLEMEGLTNE